MRKNKSKIKQESGIRVLQFLSFLLIMLSVMGSCRRVIVEQGKYKIINREIDNSLRDSVLVFGKVVSTIDTTSTKGNSRIWTTEPAKETYSGNDGRYKIKIPSGTYTINCREYMGTDEFKITTKDISFLPNEKVEISFYIGGKIE